MKCFKRWLRLSFVELPLVAVAGLALGCLHGPRGNLAPPTDISPQLEQRKIALQIHQADTRGYTELVDLVLECHNVDKENDSIAERDTPVLE